jgi:hypothetical protein
VWDGVLAPANADFASATARLPCARAPWPVAGKKKKKKGQDRVMMLHSVIVRHIVCTFVVAPR